MYDSSLDDGGARFAREALAMAACCEDARRGRRRRCQPKKECDAQEPSGEARRETAREHAVVDEMRATTPPYTRDTGALPSLERVPSP